MTKQDKIEKLAAAFGIALNSEEKAMIEQNLLLLKEGKNITLNSASLKAEKAALILACLYRGKVLIFCSSAATAKYRVKTLHKQHFNACAYSSSKVKTNKFLVASACAVKQIDFSPFKLILCFDVFDFCLNKQQQEDLKAAIRCSGIPCIFLSGPKAENLPDNYLSFKAVPNIPTARGLIKKILGRQVTKNRMPGAFWCLNGAAAEKLWRFLDKEGFKVQLYTADSKGGLMAAQAFVATSALLFNSVLRFGFSVFYGLPLNLEMFEAVVRRTGGPVSVICPAPSQYLSPRSQLILPLFEGNCIRKNLRSQGVSSEPAYILNGAEVCLNCSECFSRSPFACVYAALDKWREQQAKKEALPPVLVLSREQLISLAQRRPKTTKELKAIKGIKDAKAAKYGAEILGIIKSFEI